jgi:hypothetical protein
MDSRNGPRVARRLAVNVAWIIAGIIGFGVCIDVFGGYPQVHSEALDWAVVVLIVLAGALVWFRHERHGGE